MTQIWAHRGASADAPENTLPAFELALDQGADGLELDVQLTRDDEVVVIHDETLERTTDGGGWVADHSLADLRRLDASAGRDGFAGARIPTLGEVLDLVRERESFANVELKTDRIAYRGIEERVLDVVGRSGAGERVMFSCFNHHTLRNLRRAGAEQPLGALLSDRLLRPWRYAADIDMDALHPGLRSTTAKLVAKSQERGLRVHVWTVDDERDLRRMLALGVDAIMTNVPALAVRLRDEAAASAADAAASETLAASETTASE